MKCMNITEIKHPASPNCHLGRRVEVDIVPNFDGVLGFDSCTFDERLERIHWKRSCQKMSWLPNFKKEGPSSDLYHN